MFSCFKRSFIKSFFLKKIQTFIAKGIHFINKLIPKDNNLILSFVDYEELDGNFIPYKNDNVYMLSMHIKNMKNDINIVYIASNQFGGKVALTNSVTKKVKHIYYRFRAKILIFKQPPHLTEYFTKEQELICLGYFIPFKADYLDFTQWWVFYSKILGEDFTVENCQRYGDKVLKHFTYSDNQFKNTNLTYITASKYASKVIARSHNLPINNFKELGSLKSDIREKGKKINFNDLYNLNLKDKKVILYTPTFRDKYLGKKIDKMSSSELTIFGYENEKELESFLVENNILIVIKLHKSFPFYRELEKMYIKEDKSYFKNCYFLDFDLEVKYSISIHDLFENSDAMIADYSSISFDYLAYDKPIIYNISDIEEYREYRGFSYEPIEDMMAGERVKTIRQFKEALLNISNSKDDFIEDRRKVFSLVNEVPKGKSLENIYEYISEMID